MKKIAFWRLDNEGRLLSTYRLSDIKGFFITLLINLPFTFIVIFMTVKISLKLYPNFFLIQYISPNQMILLLTLAIALLISIVLTKPDAYSNTSMYFSIVIPAATYFKNNNVYTNYGERTELKDIKYISDFIYLMVLYKIYLIAYVLILLCVVLILVLLK